VIESSSLYLAGLLNSRLIGFILKYSQKEPGDGRKIFSFRSLLEVPVYIPDFDDPADRDRHDRMVALVTRVIGCKKKLQEIHDEPGITRLKNEIAAGERKIDRLVCDLYHLTKEEIAVIESGSPS